MKYFAPANTGVGLHWHHFGQSILPPIIETPETPQNIIKNKIVVYLPFEDQKAVINLLSPYKEFDFYLYSPEVSPSSFSHIKCNPLSRDQFQKDLYDCAGIITNAGFELASEALQLGKKILAKPLHMQMEQISNAAALKELGYGLTMNNLEVAIIEQFLALDEATHIAYPNVAKIIVQWLKDGMPTMERDFIDSIWNLAVVNKISI